MTAPDAGQHGQERRQRRADGGEQLTDCLDGLVTAGFGAGGVTASGTVVVDHCVTRDR